MTAGYCSILPHIQTKDFCATSVACTLLPVRICFGHDCRLFMPSALCPLGTRLPFVPLSFFQFVKEAFIPMKPTPARILTPYELHTGKLAKPLRFLVISDLHNEPFDDLLPLMDDADAVLVPGDISNRYRQEYDRGLAFLRESAKRRPTFFSVGNHETRQKSYRELIALARESGAEVLINRHVRFEDLWIGGWYDPEIVNEPEEVDAFEQLDGCKLLLCHKPEHYMEHLRGRKIDLTIAGHAHGGQIRIGNQGIYAPGQLLFPRYTRGWADGGKLLISAGAGKPCRMPRWNNPREVLLVTVD